MTTNYKEGKGMYNHHFVFANKLSRIIFHYKQIIHLGAIIDYNYFCLL